MTSALAPQTEQRDGLWFLARPILPLVRIVHFLYLTGPFDTVAEVVAELREPIETAAAVYEQPAVLLAGYLDELRLFERLKKEDPDGESLPRIEDEGGAPLDFFAALDQWVSHRVLTRELERINTLLCGPCNCVLCCVGPEDSEGKSMQQEFFEIPLRPRETGLFDVERVDSEASRAAASDQEEPLSVAGKPFYRTAAPRLVRWARGWSLVLPRSSRCPQLDTEGRCRSYAERPEVCRRPQIFPYLLEGEERDGEIVHTVRRKVLAVWDCPYVREHREAIISFAEQSELEPVFRENKA